MVATAWWAMRLRSGRPLYAMERDVTYKAPMEVWWPKAVLRSALYEDYCRWFEDEYLDNFRAAGLYRDNPNLLPKPQSTLAFYSGLVPFLYLMGKRKDTKVYWVRSQETYEGAYVTIRRRHYFIRLYSLKKHVEAYELHTGQRLLLE